MSDDDTYRSDSERFEVGDRFEYDPKPGETPYYGIEADKIPTETHKVVEIRDYEIITEREDIDCQTPHAWPKITVSTGQRLRPLDAGGEGDE